MTTLKKQIDNIKTIIEFYDCGIIDETLSDNVDGFNFDISLGLLNQTIITLENLNKTPNDYIREYASEYYHKHQNLNITDEQWGDYIDLDITTLDDLFDNKDEIENTVLFDAFEYAIELSDAIQEKK